MASSKSAADIGTRRLVVGAHYGLGGFVAQRLTAVVIGVYAIVFGAAVLFGSDASYDGWAGLFAPLWMKLVTLIALFALQYHAWIGLRDIWMDYVKPAGLRLALQTATVLWLVFCALWSVQILWRV